MMDTDKIEKLQQPLDKALILGRKIGGRNVQYIEGHQVIRHANKIFGFDGWSYEITRFDLTPCGTQLKKKYNDSDPDVDLYVTSVMASVRVTVGGVSREDVGCGSGLDRVLSESHEAASKEAVTDALKRAFRSFGDQFGNGLYDKRFDHTWTPDPEDEVLTKIKECKTKAALKKLHASIPANERSLYNATVTARLKELK